MLNKKTLDSETEKYLRSILDKSPEDVSEDETAFLRARMDYLTEGEKETFGLKMKRKRQLYLK